MGEAVKGSGIVLGSMCFFRFGFLGDLLSCPFPLLFAAFWSWKLPFQQHFATFWVPELLMSHDSLQLSFILGWFRVGLF